mmetsp:Transcript_11188/g.41015  ORF Transcript_11188/g.41015 Transcript_11188/m.41015 type:complete len:438 (-) Transcript_11188:61-1374(-)
MMRTKAAAASRQGWDRLRRVAWLCLVSVSLILASLGPPRVGAVGSGEAHTPAAGMRKGKTFRKGYHTPARQEELRRQAAREPISVLRKLVAQNIADVEEEEEEEPPGGLAVVAYVPDYRYGSMDWGGLAARTSHVILFSIEVNRDGSLAALERFPSPYLLTKVKEHARQHDTKLLVGVGGAGRSAPFVQMSQSAEARKRFAKQVVRLVEREELDGVDINWEAPSSPLEWKGLASLIALLRKNLDVRAKLLSMPIHIGQEKYLSDSTIASLDMIHLMAYDDLCRVVRRHPPCRHSTMELAGIWLNRLTSDSSLPLSKVTLGVPFYGRHVGTGADKTYADIVRDNPHLFFDVDDVDDTYFNGVETVAKKVELARSKGLLGVMVWEAGQDVAFDQEQSLLNAVYINATHDTERPHVHAVKLATWEKEKLDLEERLKAELR